MVTNKKEFIGQFINKKDDMSKEAGEKLKKKLIIIDIKGQNCHQRSFCTQIKIKMHFYRNYNVLALRLRTKIPAE